MDIKRITTYDELDTILHLIDRCHTLQEYCDLFPYSGYLTWLMVNFPSLGIWVAYKDGEPIGYIMAGLQINYMVKEATIYEAYSEAKDPALSQAVFDKAIEWCKENGCAYVSCYTEHDAVKDWTAHCYGFELKRYHLVKQIGV